MTRHLSQTHLSRSRLSRPAPANRRPIADIFRRTADLAVQLCVARNISPNSISYTSIVAASAAAGCFFFAADAPVLLLVGSAFCALRLWLNMLDGMVAVAAGRCTPWGEVINELPDRLSDVVIFAGLGFSGLCRPELALSAAVASVFVAYVGTLGQAVGAGRQFGGWMSKPHRMLVVGLGALWTARLLTLPTAESHLFFSAVPFSALDVALAIVFLGCIATSIQRIRAIRGRLLGELRS